MPQLESDNVAPLAGDSAASALLPAARAAVLDCTGVLAARRLTGGANQETWAFDAQTPRGTVPLILRRAQRGTLQRTTAIAQEVEARVLSIAHARGVPVPEVLHVLKPEDGLGRGFVMRRLTGETVPRKILRDDQFGEARPRLAGSCGAALAAIHAIPAEDLPELNRFTPVERVEWLHERYRATEQISPVFAYAFAWLRSHAPDPPAAFSLVHGDFRTGNLMVDGEGLCGVLDWENAHIGDCAEDLGWFCVPSWRFGNLDRPAGGFGSREDLLAGYAAGGGTPPSPARLRFWEAYGSLYWGVVCARSVNEFRTGADRTVERAMIARRQSEAELDLLRLLAPRK